MRRLTPADRLQPAGLRACGPARRRTIAHSPPVRLPGACCEPWNRHCRSPPGFRPHRLVRLFRFTGWCAFRILRWVRSRFCPPCPRGSSRRTTAGACLLGGRRRSARRERDERPVWAGFAKAVASTSAPPGPSAGPPGCDRSPLPPPAWDHKDHVLGDTKFPRACLRSIDRRSPGFQAGCLVAVTESSTASRRSPASLPGGRYRRGRNGRLGGRRSSDITPRGEFPPPGQRCARSGLPLG